MRCLGVRISVSLIAFKKTSAGSLPATRLAPKSRIIALVREASGTTKFRQLVSRKARLAARVPEQYNYVEIPRRQPTRRATTRQILTAISGRTGCFRFDNLTSQTTPCRSDDRFPVSVDGRTMFPATGGWKTNPKAWRTLHRPGGCMPAENSLAIRALLRGLSRSRSIVWTDTSCGAAGDKIYVVQTQHQGHRALPPHDHRPRRPRPRPDVRLGTTAYVAEQWGRRWITSTRAASR